MSTTLSTVLWTLLYKVLIFRALDVHANVHNSRGHCGHDCGHWVWANFVFELHCSKFRTFEGNPRYWGTLQENGTMITVNTKDATKAIAKAFWGLTSKEKNKATSRALNDAIKQTRTVAKRAITAEFAIKSKFLNAKAMPISKASPNNLLAMLSITKKPIALGNFTGGRQTAKGISLKIRKGKRALIRGAFFIPSAGRNVFARAYVTGGSAYSGGSFMFRNKRIRRGGADMPIGGMATVSPLGAARNQKVYQQMSDKAQDAYERRLIYQFDRLLKK